MDRSIYGGKMWRALTLNSRLICLIFLLLIEMPNVLLMIQSHLMILGERKDGHEIQIDFHGPRNIGNER